MPGWLASTVQVPAVSKVKLLPLTVQTSGVLDTNTTVKPELDVASNAGGGLPRVWLPGAAKLITCGMARMVKLFNTVVAAL